MIHATNLPLLAQALIEVERGHVVYGRKVGWSRLATMVNGMFERHLVEAVAPPEWMRKAGRLYFLALTDAGRRTLSILTEVKS